jgi:mutator protein MutT
MKPGKDYIGVGVGVAIWNDRGQVLLMKRGNKSYNERGAWTLPGGRVDYGEKLRDAAIREIKEELGVLIEITDATPAYDHMIPEEGQHWVTNVFEAKIQQGEPAVQEPDKCEEIGWFALSSLPEPVGKMSEPALAYFYKKYRQ